jgi:hypothetical protein
VQALGLGEIKSMDEAQSLIKSAFPIVNYDPMDTDAWDQAYPRFQALCER